MTDLFSNTSNDYIFPDLAPCAGNSDSNTFQFLPNEHVGIVSGSNILSTMDLGDIEQLVNGWTQQTKLLESGETVFISGLTKGIQQQKQVFLFDPDGSLYNTVASYPDLIIDLSVNYYRNFKHYDVSIHAEADNDTNIDSALDIAFDAKNILISTTYDASGITFLGDTAGYTIDITNVRGTNDSSTEFLTYDASLSLPAYKYPNTAMLGYVLKVTYPSTAENYESYVEIIHVPAYLEYYEASGTGGCYVRHYDKVDLGLSGKTYSDPSTMGVYDYLAYVEEHGLWEKVGLIRVWLATADPTTSTIKNLIPGFYVYNPQDFAVQIIYMTIL